MDSDLARRYQQLLSHTLAGIHITASLRLQLTNTNSRRTRGTNARPSPFGPLNMKKSA